MARRALRVYEVVTDRDSQAIDALLHGHKDQILSRHSLHLQILRLFGPLLPKMLWPRDVRCGM